MATRPSQEDSPHFPTTPSPFPPVPPVPPEKIFLALLTHRPAIYRDPWANHLEGFLISFHCIALHCIALHFTSCHVMSCHLISFIYFCSSQHQHSRRRSDHSSTQRPGDRIQGSFPISPFFPSYVNDGTAGLYPIINKGIWLPALAGGNHVFPHW